MTTKTGSEVAGLNPVVCQELLVGKGVELEFARLKGFNKTSFLFKLFQLKFFILSWRYMYVTVGMYIIVNNT